MKSREEIMNMLEAFDVAGSLRDAGELAGCSHHTVAAYVTKRDEGRLGGAGPVRRERIIDPWLAKIEEWVERSCGKIRADRCHAKLKALGFEGSDRTVRRAVAEAKKSFGAGRRRVYRPWIPEPGMWAQWDWGAGPVIAGRRTNLFCAWLAWSRFRVVIATWDRTLPTVIACVDRAMRAFGGAPTYWLTDNERTVTIDHVAGVPVRHPEMVAVGGHYGITVATCVPADPESKGGSEATVRVAKADLGHPAPTADPTSPSVDSGLASYFANRWYRSRLSSVVRPEVMAFRAASEAGSPCPPMHRRCSAQASSASGTGRRRESGLSRLRQSRYGTRTLRGLEPPRRAPPWPCP